MEKAEVRAERWALEGEALPPFSDPVDLWVGGAREGKGWPGER